MTRLATTETFEREVDALARQASGDKPRALSSTDEVVRDAIVQRLATTSPGAVSVRVPSSPDQFEYVALNIGAQLGVDALRKVDEKLRARPSGISQLLQELLHDRPLIVEGADQLGAFGSGTDEALKSALDIQLAELREFFDKKASLLVTSVGKSLLASTKAPFTTDDGEDLENTWQSFGCQPTLFQLWLSLRKLQGVPASRELPEYLPDADSLRNQLQAELSGDERKLLHVLCAHSRPLPRVIISAMSLGRVIDIGAQLRIWHQDDRDVWLTCGWSPWWERTQLEQDQVACHRLLADLFNDESVRGPLECAGPSLLEAHRHYSLAGDDEQAKRSARYGVGVIVNRARTLSKEGDYLRAASLYEFVTECAELQKLPINNEMHAYAVHYSHYNRYRASAHTVLLRDTIAGYKHACALWPENAHFWSRLVRAHLYKGEPETALDVLEQALAKVPEHPRKHTVLRARSVDRLLEKDQKFEAMLVWGDYEAHNHLEHESFAGMRKALFDGWETRWLQVPRGPHLVFQRLVRVRLEYVEKKKSWIAELPELGDAATERIPIKAVGRMIEGLRKETLELVRAFTHELSPTQRFRKQRLLGTIDIVTSGLQAKVPDHVWALGELERDSNTDEVSFRLSKDDVRSVSPDALASIEFDRHPRLGYFATDGVGRPKGPALKLSDAFRGSASDLWESFRKARANG